MVGVPERGDAETCEYVIGASETISGRAGCDTKAGERPHGCLHTGIGWVASVGSIGSSLLRDSTKGPECADGADDVQDVSVLDSHDYLAVGCDRNVHRSVLLGQRLGLDIDAILDAGASHDDRLVTDALHAVISVRLASELSFDQAAQIQAYHGLDTRVACHDVGECALGHPITDGLDSGDCTRRRLCIGDGWENSNSAAGYFRRELILPQSRRDEGSRIDRRSTSA